MSKYCNHKEAHAHPYILAGGRSTLAAQKTKTYQCIPLYTSMTQTEQRRESGSDVTWLQRF